MKNIALFCLVLVIGLTSCDVNKQDKSQHTFNTSMVTAEDTDTLRYEKEVHLKNMKQLTFGGDNAEAY